MGVPVFLAFVVAVMDGFAVGFATQHAGAHGYDNPIAFAIVILLNIFGIAEMVRSMPEYESLPRTLYYPPVALPLAQPLELHTMMAAVARAALLKEQPLDANLALFNAIIAAAKSDASIVKSALAEVGGSMEDLYEAVIPAVKAKYGPLIAAILKSKTAVVLENLGADAEGEIFSIWAELKLLELGATQKGQPGVSA